jgi:membrane-bound lytic murein transglycosylase D
LLFFVFALSVVWAADSAGFPAAEVRPLRNIPVYDVFAPVRHSPESVPFAHNSLLTASALEQPLTRRYIEQYSSPGGIAWLSAVMRQGSVYLPFIKGEIAKRNLPPELLYLPAIESGFLSSARSRSGAVGLWQFMLNSIGPYNMKVNDMVDERRDFQKSTVGALRKLEENYRALGNWPMALAAYNSGLGGINRIVRRSGSRDYWLLSAQKKLKNETIQYVPKLLAVAWILSQPRRFGLDYWPEAVEWTALPVGRQASIDLIAAEAGVDRELLRLGNMELLYGITPSDSEYRLKVPAAAYPLVAAALERENLKLLQYYRYTVKYGDTLSALARHYGVTLDLIEQHNPGILKRYLKIGETVVIPAFRETSPYQGGAAPQAAAGGERPFTGTYTVKKGDTLWSLALSYGVDVLELAGENGMELNQILPEGKQLKVPIIR